MDLFSEKSVHNFWSKVRRGSDGECWEWTARRTDKGYGQFALGRERFQELPVVQKTVRCGDCGECTVKCGHGVNVAARMSRAQELFA